MKTKPVYMMKGRKCVPLSQCGDNFGYCLDIDTMETFSTYGFNTAHFNKDTEIGTIQLVEVYQNFKPK